MFLNKKKYFLSFLFFLFFSLFIISFDFYTNSFSKIKLFFNKMYFTLLNYYSNVFLYLKSRIIYFTSIDYIFEEIINCNYNNLLFRKKKYEMNNIIYENNFLKSIYKIPILKNEKYSIVKVFNIDWNNLLINIYNYNNIKYGNLLFNGLGIIGKLIYYDKNFGKLQLICDNSSGFPGKILRTNLKVLVMGNGCGKYIEINDIPIGTDIKVGDIVLYYDIYGHYFSYPIGIIKEISIDSKYGDINAKVESFVYFNNSDFNILIK